MYKDIATPLLAFAILLVACSQGADGILDCPTDVTFVEEPERAEDASGTTSQQAISDAMSRHASVDGGEVNRIDETTYSVSIDGNERIVISLVSADRGGVFVSEVRGADRSSAAPSRRDSGCWAAGRRRRSPRRSPA